MAGTFFQSMRALEADRPRVSLRALAACAVLALGWLVWFFCARLTVFETSVTARLETERAPHSVDASVAGRIVSTKLTLGAQVHAGDILVELETDTLKARLAEERARLERLAPEIAAVGRILRAREETLSDEQQAALAETSEARARQSQAQIVSALSDEELARTARLRDAGAISDIELLRSKAESQRRRAASRETAFEVKRGRNRQRAHANEIVAQMEELHRDLASLEGRQATTQATIEQLLAEIDKRVIRAPVDGRVEDVAPLAPGSYVREGERVGVIVPAGPLRAIAEFAPRTAVGRLRPDQLARLRLDGYPWTQFGDVPAHVTSVATEARDGLVRVELEIVDAQHSRIPLQHGMTGSAEVVVERVSPAALVLRMVGKQLGRAEPIDEPPPPPSPPGSR